MKKLLRFLAYWFLPDPPDPEYERRKVWREIGFYE